MSDELSRLNLRDDFGEAGEVPEASRWILEMRSDLEVFVTLAPAREPNEKFQERLIWTKYPDAPPSLKFRDPRYRASRHTPGVACRTRLQAPKPRRLRQLVRRGFRDPPRVERTIPGFSGMPAETRCFGSYANYRRNSMNITKDASNE